MRATKRIGSFFLALLLASGLLTGIASADGERRAPLSPALAVLSQNTDLALWGLAGEDLVLDAESFLRGFNLSTLESVRICSLPDRTVGRLSFDGKTVQVGARFSAGELSRLSFEVASLRTAAASFSFEINDCGVEYTCCLYLLASPNASPAISEIPILLQALHTHQNLTQTGRFFAEDPEDDPLSFEISTCPKYGSISVSGDTYYYQPFHNYTGEDSFCYVARDRYGNYSSSVKVSIFVSGEGGGFVYEDLSDDPSLASSARTLAANSILDGTKVGNLSCFYPDRSISRADFLVAAMSAAGILDLPDCTDTGFADDDEIPGAVKPYVAVAYRLGYLGGRVKDGAVFFMPNEAITYSEATSLIDRLLLPDAKGRQVALAGTKQTQELASLVSLGVISVDEAPASSSEALTRRSATKLLENVFFLTHGKNF